MTDWSKGLRYHVGFGFSCGETYESIIMDEGIDKPSREDLIEGAEIQHAKDLTIDELNELDKVVTRGMEAFYLANPEADSFIYEKVLKKIELRQKLL